MISIDFETRSTATIDQYQEPSTMSPVVVVGNTRDIRHGNRHQRRKAAAKARSKRRV